MILCEISRTGSFGRTPFKNLILSVQFWMSSITFVRNRRAWISSGTGLMHSPYCIKLKWIAPLQNMIKICQIQRFNLYCMNLYTHWILPIYLWRKLFPHSKEGLICALNTLLTWKCCRKHEMSWSQPNFLSFPIWMPIWTMYCFSCL